jgi:hypothetical protein
MPSGLIAPHVQAFFADYLCQQKRLSPQTVVSCRDTFRLWLTLLRDQTGVEPSALRLTDVDAPAVLRGYPETLSSCHRDIKQHSCGNETPDDYKTRVC